MFLQLFYELSNKATKRTVYFAERHTVGRGYIIQTFWEIYTQTKFILSILIAEVP